MAQGKFIDKTGETNMNNQGLKMTIIEYYNSGNITIKFEDGSIRNNIQYSHFKNGQVKSLFYPTLCGVGYIGETNTHENNKPLKSYQCWRSMLERCYSEAYQKRQPTYKDCVVCDEWLCYANFKKWYENNVYNIEDKLELDKDILIKGNKIYSPNNCIFVLKIINSLFSAHDRRDNLPIGVKKQDKGYIARIRIDGKLKYLGYYETPEKAFYIYKEAKEKEIKRVADLYKDKIPQKLYEAMYSYDVEITD